MSVKTVTKPGYKKTKLGWIPEAWPLRLLDQVSKRGSGHTPNKKLPEYYNGGVKWISLADSNRLDKGEICTTTIEISKEGLANSSAVLHPQGTVLLSRDAGVGKSAVMGENMAVSQHFITWTTDEVESHNWFLYYWLQFRKSEFERMAVGSTIKTIGLPFFKKYKIPLPPLPEQRQIARILSTWDKAITTLQKLIAKKQERKKGLMQQLLSGKKRFAGFDEEWKEVRLGQIAEIIMGQSPSSSSYNQTGEGKWLIQGNADIENRKTSPRYCTTEPTKICQPGDIIMTVRAPVGAIAISHHEACIGRGVCVIRGSVVEPNFLYHWLVRFETKWIKLEQGSTFTAVSSKDVKNLKVSVPQLLEQQKIASILSTVDREIEKLQEQLEKLQEQKKGLMQKLLTGEVRVKTN